MARYVVMLHYLISSFGIFILILYCTGNIIDNRERENRATAGLKSSVLIERPFLSASGDTRRKGGEDVQQ